VNHSHSMIKFLLCMFIISITLLSQFLIVDAQYNSKTSSVGTASFGTISYVSSSLKIQALLNLHVDGKQLKDEDGNVIVLRGVYFGSDQFGHYDANQMEYIKSMGCNAVAISIGYWDIPDFSSVLNTVDSMMASAKRNGLYVIFRPFTMAGTTLEDHGSSTSDWLSKWTVLAQRYASYSNIIYEPINEYLWWTNREYSDNIRSCIDIIRTYSPNAIVCVAGGGNGDGSWDSLFDFQSTNPINKPNIMFGCDPYGWFTFPENSQYEIWNKLSNWFNFPAISDFPLIFTEFGGEYLGQGRNYDSWGQTFVQNFMATMDSHGASGYCAFKWYVSAGSDTASAIITNWNGNLSTYGNDLKNYYLWHDG
jgi:hypothetical protein